MKSFRVYLRPPEPEAPTEPREYSAEERLRLRQAFQLQAAAYRRRTRILYLGFAGFAGCFALSALFQHLGVFMAAALICWLVGMLAAILGPSLVCPGCSGKMEHRFGRYCPECGRPTLEPGRWFRAPHCTACGKSMERGKGRRYTIRACTHCGLMLDEEGL